MRNPGAAKYRLKKKALIDGLFQRKATSRQSISTPSVVLIYDSVASTDGDHVRYRAAVTATRRLKRAVDRNRVKRVLREAIRLRHSSLLKLPSSDDTELIFIMVYKGQDPKRDFRSDADSVIETMISHLSSQGQPHNGTS
ncbi:MAG: ribonuclease P protein component [Rhodothermales bacterium]|nr:ribonuclease P protein component [Rhodothermales bacterium]